MSTRCKESPLKALENRLYPTPVQQYPDNWAAKCKLKIFTNLLPKFSGQRSFHVSRSFHVFQARHFELETSNRTVLVVYDSLPYSKVVEFCHCIKMDLAAPRSMEEAQEIDRRGELKFDYFTNYVRIRLGFCNFA